MRSLVDKIALYVVTFKQGSATGHKSINPGCVNTTNYLLIYARDKADWKPNRVLHWQGKRYTVRPIHRQYREVRSSNGKSSRS